MAERKPSILLIDDREDLLGDMRDQLSALVPTEEAEIRIWVPSDAAKSPLESFGSKIDDETILVVTDYDLTGRGVTGLFGATIVSWCQSRALPVGDFSRANTASIPKEPNLFELRVPTVPEEAAQFTASAFRGFKRFRDLIVANEGTSSAKGSPAAALASLLGRPHLESQFTLYMSRLGSANSSLFDRLRNSVSPEEAPEKDKKARLLAYVLGHVLLNAVLKYPDRSFQYRLSVLTSPRCRPR